MGKFATMACLLLVKIVVVSWVGGCFERDKAEAVGQAAVQTGLNKLATWLGERRVERIELQNKVDGLRRQVALLDLSDATSKESSRHSAEAVKQLEAKQARSKEQLFNLGDAIRRNAPVVLAGTTWSTEELRQSAGRERTHYIELERQIRQAKLVGQSHDRNAALTASEAAQCRAVLHEAETDLKILLTQIEQLDQRAEAARAIGANGLAVGDAVTGIENRIEEVKGKVAGQQEYLRQRLNQSGESSQRPEKEPNFGKSIEDWIRDDLQK